MKIRPRFVAPLGAGLLLLALSAFLWVAPAPANAQEQSSAPQTSPPQPSAEPRKDYPAQKGIAGELVQETREASGEEHEDNENLKHSSTVRWLARKTNLSVHGMHLLATSLNFAIVAVVAIWAARKFLPAMFRNRTHAIQQALEEARAASDDANRRLADIEARLQHLNGEIGRMQVSGENEGAADEARIQKAAEEDVRKVVLAAEQEIASAAKQARRELAAHTADLAVALARKQINVDSNTDQVLVRTFTAKLTTNNDGGKDGR
jgi:F-type H+-transporting ATPase subunit b